MNTKTLKWTGERYSTYTHKTPDYYTGSIEGIVLFMVIPKTHKRLRVQSPDDRKVCVRFKIPMRQARRHFNTISDAKKYCGKQLEKFYNILSK